MMLRIDPRVDSLLQEYASETDPGLAVMVIRDGEVLHANGYGVADRVTARPLTPQTPLRLGSVSKQLVAFTTVLLQERGLLQYDDPAVRWIPEIAGYEGITVRHLLTHTSGLPDYYDFEALLEAAEAATDPPFTNADAAAFYQTEPVEPLFEPGAGYAYSNPGYELLALITERATERSFKDFIESELFRPIGMRTAQVRDLPGTIIPERAIGYTADSTGAWIENDDHPYNWMIGAGGIYASLEDLYRWDQALWRWADEGDRLAEAFSPTTLTTGEVSDYGFGWAIGQDPPRVEHAGGWVGFVTFLRRYLDDRLTVVVLSNASLDSEEIANRVAGMYREGG
jgi:CubicO group peptidase (beta-lactamase class C family)